MVHTLNRLTCGACKHSLPLPLPAALPAPCLVRCPQCGALCAAGQTEWVQLSPMRKLLCFDWALRLSCAAVLLLPCVLWLMGLPLPAALLSGVSIALLMGWLLMQAQCNSARFLAAYADSLRRTKNAQYLSLLKTQGRLHGDALPLGLSFTKKNAALVAANLTRGMVPAPEQFVCTENGFS